MSSNPGPDPKPALTRIPLRQVWFTADLDLPGGHAITQSVACGKPETKGRQYFLGYFVPSFQIIELEWYRTEDAEPKRRRIPMSFVQQMDY